MLAIGSSATTSISLLQTGGEFLFLNLYANPQASVRPQLDVHLIQCTFGYQARVFPKPVVEATLVNQPAKYSVRDE